MKETLITRPGLVYIGRIYKNKSPDFVGTRYNVISFFLTYLFFLAAFFLAAFFLGAAFLAAFFFVAMFLNLKWLVKKILSTVKIEIFLNCQKFFQHF
jgi:hypothetical protein